MGYGGYYFQAILSYRETPFPGFQQNQLFNYDLELSAVNIGAENPIFQDSPFENDFHHQKGKNNASLPYFR
ncbi:hypothetical protein CW705_04895 [Candidatus Bathyarchaeota archaeon]|nr:MAG: hypothetical protein CW705_04895 [Candidatus Bathyarchaeota archaeon]